MNMPILETESTLSDSYQTTIPESVRKALKLGKQDKIHYSIYNDEYVLLSKGQESNTEDPVLSNFLNFLSKDILDHPDRIQVIDIALVNRLHSLVCNVPPELNAPLQDDET